MQVVPEGLQRLRESYNEGYNSRSQQSFENCLKLIKCQACGFANFDIGLTAA